MNNFLSILNPENLQAVSFIANVVFVTWGAVSFLKDRKHKRELANIFSAEYKTTKALAEATKDQDKQLQIQHVAEFLKAVARNYSNRSNDEVGGEHNNFVIRWLEKIIHREKSKNK